jgi:conjugal transfer mating pair stabilization protein TraN
MRQTAQWVADLFGEAAANSLFTVNGGAAFVGGNPAVGKRSYSGRNGRVST